MLQQFQGRLDPLHPSREIIAFAGLTIRFLVTGDEANGSIAAFELGVGAGRLLPGPAHSHDHYEETIYGLEGVLSWTIDGKAIDLGPGDAFCIPRGIVHRFDNKRPEDAKALCVVTPAAIGPEYFREVAALLAAGGPPDAVKMGELMRRYGLKPAAPPRA
jgi:quercetin dioxygenase-like cupin family protein